MSRKRSHTSALLVVVMTIAALATVSLTSGAAHAAPVTYDLPPFKTIAGSATQIDSPAAIAVDDEGSIYLTNADGNSVTVYSKETPGGNAAPTKILTGPNTGLSLPVGVVVRPNGDMYVSNLLGSINYYAAGWESGDTAPTKVLMGDNTQLSLPLGIAFNSSGTMFVTMPLGSALLAFDGSWINEPSSVVDVEPIGFAAGVALNVPAGIAVDSSDKVYVANNGLVDVDPGSVGVYQADWYTDPSFNGTPVSSLSGSQTQIVNPTGLTIDDDDNLYVNNQATDSILRFDAGWASGDTEPDIVLSGPTTQIVDPRGTVIDKDGIQYVANDNNSLTAYSFVARGRLSPSPADFGEVEVGGAPGQEVLTLTNIGASPLSNNESPAAITGAQAADFTVTDDQCIAKYMQPTEICTITVSFSPSGAGQRTALLTVPHLDGAPDTEVELEGLGTSSPATSQSITFGPLQNRPVNAPPFVVSASASSGLPVSFSSLTDSVCSVSGADGSTVSVQGVAGTCTIAANQAGNETYAAAEQVTQSFEVYLGQVPVAGCVKDSKQKPIPARGTRTLMAPKCRTTADQVIAVSVSARQTRGDVQLYRLFCAKKSGHYTPQQVLTESKTRAAVCPRGGSLKIKTFGHELRFKISWSAPGVGEYAPYFVRRTYRTP